MPSMQHLNFSPLTKTSQVQPWKGQSLLGGEHQLSAGFPRWSLPTLMRQGLSKLKDKPPNRLRAKGVD